MFPLEPRGKAPAIPNAEGGSSLKDVSTDLVVIPRWWARWPEPNVRVATNAAAGVVVLDVDGEEGEASPAALRDGSVSAETRTARTDGERPGWLLGARAAARRWTHTWDAHLDGNAGVGENRGVRDRALRRAYGRACPGPTSGGRVQERQTSAAEGTGAAGGPSVRSAWPGLALIVAGALWLYRGALGSGFFADDYLFLDQVRGHSLLAALRLPDPLSNFYRPVSRQLYFWVVAGLTHESPGAFHVGNLFLLLVAIVLLFAIARRLAGDRAGLVAAGLLALHYTADVPVRWACGSQELLAVVGAMGALLLHLSGRRVWAGVAMLLAALSKEVILLMPLIAVVADRRPGERWAAAARRAWPLGAAVAAWALVWLLMPHTRVAQGTEVEFDFVNSPLAAFAHLPRVLLGFEWRQGEFGRLPNVLPPLIPLAAVLVAIAWTWGWSATGAASVLPGGAGDAARFAAEAGRGRRRDRRSWAPRRAGAADATEARPGRPGWRVPHAVLVGLVWAGVATLPVAAVAILWSAYYYLFAICGLALAIGALLARRHVAWTLVVLVVLAWGSASARSLGEFAVARDPWTPQSHINRHYIERSNRIVARYLGSLRRAYPRFERGSTLFFGGLMANVAFQRADGPLIRWAYRDSSLHAYYLNMFTRDKVRRGPLHVFVASGDTLCELDRGDDLYLRIGFGLLVSDHPEGARDALELQAERDTANHRADYWLAWARWASGDTLAALASLRHAGIEPRSRTATERPRALAAMSAGDTLGALWIMQSAVRAAPLDAAAHALLADLLLVRQHEDPEGAVEALAARLLAPGDPTAWRRWGMVQLDRGRYLEALRSFERYQALGDPQAARDSEVQGWVEGLRGRVQGAPLAIGDSGP